MRPKRYSPPPRNTKKSPFAPGRCALPADRDELSRLAIAPPTASTMRPWISTRTTTSGRRRKIHQQLAKIYPASKYLSDAIYNAAIKYEEIQDWRNAARVFEWFVEQNPEDKEAKDMLFQAGKYYGKVGDDQKAQELFAKFSKKYPNDIRVIEIQYEVAMSLYRKEKFAEAKTKFYDVLAAYNAANKPIEYIHRAAESDFLITEMDYKDYAAIQFKQPEAALKAAVKQKTDLLKSINEKYAQVAAYGLINWTPEALYKIGRNVEDFANAFENQELPPNLPKEELINRQRTIKLQLAASLERVLEPDNATISLQNQLKGDPKNDTLIIPWVLKAKRKTRNRLPDCLG